MKACRCEIYYEHPHEMALGYGTGYIISKDCVLTPAHNIYDKIQNIPH
jgi:hypothetical protein